MPPSNQSQSATFSNYKYHNTAKSLRRISPIGAVLFVSDLYTGRNSGKQIPKRCGILSSLETDDNIMADRGFGIEDDLPLGVTLNISSFLKGQPQLSLEDVVHTRRIALARIHNERAIQRTKYDKLLQAVLRLSVAPDFNKILVICSYLTNLLPPLIAQGQNDIDE